ncbi:MAG: MFS transporter [Crenarchaeota archaeon]|nr:MFS transporter [Thermoproteota archaeon]
MSTVALSHIIVFLLFFSVMSSAPYVLREAHLYGSAAIGTAVGAASLASLGTKLFTSKKGVRAKYGLEWASLLVLLSSFFPVLGYGGFFAFMVLTEVAFALILIITLVVVAEVVEPSRLGFHYAVRGMILSLAAFLAPLAGGLAYSAYGLLGALGVRAASAALLYVVQKPLRGYVIKVGSGFSLSRRWALAYLTSFFLASSFLIISTYLPPYQASAGSSYLSTTYFFSGRALGSGAVRYLGGVIADAAPYLIFVPSLVMLWASIMAVGALDPLLSGATGFLVGSSWGLASPALLATAAKESEKGKSVSLFITGWDVASMTAVPLAGYLGSYQLSLSSSVVAALAALAASLALSYEARLSR